MEPPSHDFRKFIGSIRHIAPNASYWDVWQAFKVSFRKGQAFDRIERAALETRCFETHRGDTDAVRGKAFELVSAAKSPAEIVSAETAALKLFDDMPKREIEPLKISLVGEFFLLLEPFINFDIETYLGERGVYVGALGLPHGLDRPVEQEPGSGPHRRRSGRGGRAVPRLPRRRRGAGDDRPHDDREA